MQLTDEHFSRVRNTAECLYSTAQVEEALESMAMAISARLAHANPILMCVMNGGLIPMGKLLTRLDFRLQADYLHATRYRDQTTGGELSWKARPHLEIKDRTLLIVDDILDEGLTLQEIVNYCTTAGAREVLTAVLVEKLHARKYGLKRADFVGLQVPDRYVFGYGMDYKGFLRNAPGIFAVKQEYI